MTRFVSRLLGSAAFAAALASVAPANDGFGGLTATGLQFDQTGVVQMLSEDLYLSLDKIKIAYVFRHSGDEDLTGEVIFPLPPINLPGTYESDFAIPTEERDRENLVNFKAVVDGKNVPVKVDRIAVIEPGWSEERKAKDDLTKLGYASFDEGGEPYPGWSIIERYHWTQTFPAGKDVKIEHSYDGAFPGGIFIWRDPTAEEGDYASTIIKQYCIDEGTQKAIKGALKKEGEAGDVYYNGMAYYLDYVLTTANTWAGPIGSFKLTIDKGNPKNAISLCIDGIKKTGPTTFVVEKKDFTPASDISILLVPDVSTLPQ